MFSSLIQSQSKMFKVALPEHTIFMLKVNMKGTDRLCRVVKLSMQCCCGQIL